LVAQTSAGLATAARPRHRSDLPFAGNGTLYHGHYDAQSKIHLWAAQQPHIQQVYYVTGAVDIIAIITAEDVTQYDDITAHIMAENPQIKRIHTNVVLKELKIGLFVPVP
jgi:Lrp/AsnC family leucine-responsive transcriptional regulator